MTRNPVSGCANPDVRASGAFDYSGAAPLLLGIFRLVEPYHSLEVFGVKLVGINGQSARRLLLSLVLIAGIVLISAALRGLLRIASKGRGLRIAFWMRQAIHVISALVLIVGLVSLWFDDPSRLATAAGLAFALQRAVLALAGYMVILRGNTFTVGDRITMGGVRGDVIALGFMQTTIMEMGQMPDEQNDAPAMWVKARQYTGRIVTVSNDKIFDTPVYNYSKDFPYIWEELSLPIRYKDDRATAERIVLEAAHRQAVQIDQSSEREIVEMERRFGIERADLEPRVYWRLTDNWLEMTVRLVTAVRGAPRCQGCDESRNTCRLRCRGNWPGFGNL